MERINDTYRPSFRLVGEFNGGGGGLVNEGQLFPSSEPPVACATPQLAASPIVAGTLLPY